MSIKNVSKFTKMDKILNFITKFLRHFLYEHALEHRILVQHWIFQVKFFCNAAICPKHIELNFSKSCQKVFDRK